MVTIQGELTRRLYTSPDSLFHVYALDNGQGETNAVYVGKNPPQINLGYVFRGHWSTHYLHGRQFVIKRFQCADEHQAMRQKHVGQINRMINE